MKRVSFSKGIFLFPSLCTTGSLFCGFFSIVKSLSGDYFQAVWAIFFAGFFDLIDGRLARMTKTQSNFGMEYDSLSDLVAFGLAPALLSYTWALNTFHRIGWLVSFVFVACGALRLARFNVQILTVEKKRFQGLPIPMAAGAVVSFVLFSETVFRSGGAGEGWETTRNTVALLLTLGMATLMVSNVRYRSFKDFEFRGRKAFTSLLIAVILILLVGLDARVMPFVFYISYVISGPIEEIFFLRQRRLERRQRKVTSRRLAVIRKGGTGEPGGETTPWLKS